MQDWNARRVIISKWNARCVRSYFEKEGCEKRPTEKSAASSVHGSNCADCANGNIYASAQAG